MPEAFGNEVYIVDGTRTSFIKAKNKPGRLSASDLAVCAARELLSKLALDPQVLEEIILGCVMPNADEANIARIVGLRLGCGPHIPAWTVQRNCASGMQALDSAVQSIQSGRHNLVLAGGTEAMSRAPLLYNEKMTNWFSEFSSAKGMQKKLKTSLKFRPSFLKPTIALLKGLTDSTVNLSMGQTAENIAYRFGITREQMDTFALESHLKCAATWNNKNFPEVVTTFNSAGEYYLVDDGIRADSTLEKLAGLKPIFDKKYGKVTAGNSSQVTDGACVLLLASKQAIDQHHLPVLAKIVDIHWAGVAPEEMGLGPVHASASLLRARHLSLNDIDYFEINEAFAGQVLACLAAMKDEHYCKVVLGLEHPLGVMDEAKLNVEGGAIALGHPIGASGARIVLQLAEILQRNRARKGLASICIGGGQGGAMLIERM